jgi:protein-tyrosine phosphatase
LQEPNLTFVTAHLAIGGRIAPHEVEHLAHALAIRGVVDLRVEECDDEALFRRSGLAWLHLPTEDLAALSQPMLDEGVRFAAAHLDRGERVLVHCEHGIGRSATLALCILVARGFAPLKALERAKARRPLVSPSPAQYEAWAAWLARRRDAQGAAWAIPDFDAFRAIAYRHLQGAA